MRGNRFVTIALGIAVLLLVIVAAALGGGKEQVVVRDANGIESATSVDSAREQRDSLMPRTPRTWTAMARPAATPRVVPTLLRQTRRRGHVGIYRERPAGFEPAAIVIHATGSGRAHSGFSNLTDLRIFFQRKGVASSHYAIDRQGHIAQLVDDSNAAFHVATPGWNDVSIGIELLNDNTGREPYPPAQLRAARLLVQSLGAKYDIPVEAVLTHRMLQPADRRDPVGFPWRAFVASLSRSR